MINYNILQEIYNKSSEFPGHLNKEINDGISKKYLGLGWDKEVIDNIVTDSLELKQSRALENIALRIKEQFEKSGILDNPLVLDYIKENNVDIKTINLYKIYSPLSNGYKVRASCINQNSDFDDEYYLDEFPLANKVVTLNKKSMVLLRLEFIKKEYITSLESIAFKYDEQWKRNIGIDINFKRISDLWSDFVIIPILTTIKNKTSFNMDICSTSLEHFRKSLATLPIDELNNEEKQLIYKIGNTIITLDSFICSDYYEKK